MVSKLSNVCPMPHSTSAMIVSASSKKKSLSRFWYRCGLPSIATISACLTGPGTNVLVAQIHAQVVHHVDQVQHAAAQHVVLIPIIKNANAKSNAQIHSTSLDSEYLF